MKTTHIQIRVTPDEKRAFKEAASTCNRKLSDWMRLILRHAAGMDLATKDR